MASERIDPLFFGTQGRRLYGCHHAPLAAGAPRLGVVIAPPFGHEAVRAHRALRQLAARCAQGGARALRFDFEATGDSAGEAWPESFAAWEGDLEAALRELSLRARVERTGLVAVRLAGSLALACAARRPIGGPLVLWEPVLDGAVFRRGLVELERRFQESLAGAPAPADPPAGGLECLGQGWPGALLDRLERWRAPRFVHPAAPRVLLLQAQPDDAGRELARDLERSGSRVLHEASSGSEPWNDDVDRGLVPAADLRRIADFVLELAP